MPRLRNADDQVVDVDEKDVGYYTANGWSVDDASSALGAFKREVARPEDTGLVGQLGAAATSFVSGATLGASDILTGQLATDATIEQIRNEKLANPITSTLGTIAGAVGPAFAAPGSLLARTPAGALSRVSASATEGAPLAARLGAYGAEGAAQNVGAYLGEVSLGDKQLSAEALAAAAGSGFAVGAAGGAAALGIEKGTIAARKLFSRTAEGSDRAIAEAKTAWERARSEAVDAHEQAATLARARLEEARVARESAELARRETMATVAEEQATIARNVAEEATRKIAPEAEEKIASALTEFDEAKAALDAMKVDIAAGKVPGEIGPFQPRGLEAAAQRELARRAAVQPADVAAPAAAPPSYSRRPVKVSQSASLEEQLAAMKARLDDGATLTDLNAEAAVAKADAPTFVDEIGEEVAAVSRYETAAAKVADALGDEAPPAARRLADALREAEAKADDRLLNQTVRGVDDVPSPPVARLQQVKVDLADANVVLARARAAEVKASSANRLAKNQASKARREFDIANPPPVAESAGVSFDGIPGISHIPVVGPLLNAWMKARVATGIAGRLTGRIPATGTSKIAALAARTKSNVARAVDRSLGIIEAGARAAQPVAARASVAVAREALMKRAFDDGEPSAPDGASLTRLAAVRVREVTAAASQPDRVAEQVRRELRDVDDPDIVEASVQHQIAKYQHLASVAPKSPPPNPFSTRDWEPSPALAMQFARRLDAADNPESVLDDLEHQCLAPESADTLRVVYPRIFEMARQRLLDRAGDLNAPLSYTQRVRNSLMFQLSLDSSMEPDGITELQAVHAPIPEQQTSAPAAPSISSSVDLMSLQQTGLDRRAMR